MGACSSHDDARGRSFGQSIELEIEHIPSEIEVSRSKEERGRDERTQHPKNLFFSFNPQRQKKRAGLLHPSSSSFIPPLGPKQRKHHKVTIASLFPHFANETLLLLSL